MFCFPNNSEFFILILMFHFLVQFAILVIHLSHNFWHADRIPTDIGV
jgi:hypothetical protein